MEIISEDSSKQTIYIKQVGWLLFFSFIMIILYSAYTQDPVKNDRGIVARCVLTGNSCQFKHQGYGIIFTYPREWNLAITKARFGYGEDRDRIVITQETPEAFLAGDGGTEMSIYISPENNVYLDGNAIAKKIADHRSSYYGSIEKIGGMDFPCSLSTGGSISTAQGHGVSVSCLFSHRGTLFRATYEIFPGEGRYTLDFLKQYEPDALNIIRNIKFE